MPTRQQLYALIHIGATRLGYADDADYRNWLQSLVGKRSLKDCSAAELASLATTLRACNALDDPRQAGIKGATTTTDRPSRKQWGRADQLCRQLGLNGCADPGFVVFVRRTTGLDHPRFLTRSGMSKVLTGLERWLQQRQAKEGGA